MKQKSLIEKKLRKKTNSELVETIILAKKKKEWLKVADLLSKSRRGRIKVNLDRIEKETNLGETVVIPGKVLGVGEISKKIRVVAFNFSEGAKEKLAKTKSEVVSIIEEIKKNPNAQGVKIIA